MINYYMMYDIIYALAARDGREKALFGTCAPLAHAAFKRSCVGNAFPELWFELPLLGEPWFDLHVLTSSEALDPTMTFAPDNTAGHPEIFAWFAGAPDVRQLALSFDVGRGDIDNPAVQLLVSDTRMHEEFLTRVGGPKAAEAYRTLARRIPKGWFACYTGTFPGRPGSVMHVECIPNEALQQAYAKDAALLASHFEHVGLKHVDDEMVSRCQLFADTPFSIEFQLELLEDGTLGDTFAVSARFTNSGEEDGRAWFNPLGEAGTLMKHVEEWGLADGRWRLLADTASCKSVKRGEATLVAATWPAFVKLRWKGSTPLDAKAYIISTIE